MQPVVIFGTGGHALQVLEWLEHAIENGLQLQPVGFLDSDASRWGMELGGLRVLGDESWLDSHPRTSCIIAIGNPHSKARVADTLRRKNINRPTLVHPSALVSKYASIGEGCIICPNAVVGRSARLGSHVTVNIGALVAHDAIVSDYCHIAPSAQIAGAAHIGELTEIGANASVIQKIRIGKHCVIGAGATVIRDIDDFSVAVGTPAVVIRNSREAKSR